MSWLTNFVRPKIQAWVRKSEVPDNLWDKCPNCGQMIFHRELEANLRVCPHCGHHMRLTVAKRLELLFDDGGYHRIDLPKADLDPLKFRDRKRYTDRLKESQSSTGEADAIVVAKGRIGAHPAVVAAFNFDFMGGSMGVAVGDGLVAAARLAIEDRAPLIVIPASGGARMQEGILALMQLPKTICAIDELHESGGAMISVLTHPTTGGVLLSFETARQLGGDVRAAFAELAGLKRAIGKSGFAALRALLPFSRNDYWEVSELRQRL